MKTFALTVFGTLAVLMLASVVFIWSGIYNVAADVPHYDATHWVLEKARDKSIESHSKGIKPPDLKARKLLEKGLDHYHGMCRLCHGAPGFNREEFAQGLYPVPPDLNSEHVQKEWSDAELFWIVKNGLKMTGMPAFGSTHSDEDLWGTVSFARKLENLKPEQYREMIETAGLGTGEGHSHSHGGAGSHH